MLKYEEMLRKKLLMSPFRNANGQRGGKQVMENYKHTQEHKELLRKMIGEVKNK